MDKDILSKYQVAREQYGEYGIDTEIILRTLKNVALSIHCWQADDVAGFEKEESGLGDSGLQITRQYPGKPRNMDEFRDDLQKFFSLIPGNHRLSLHAS